ncbi:MAG: molybdenum cofactor biosynthesis protein B [Myxococcales bacterium]|nr:molybdenum cofactor biosynthesis protein B [Myxococcales bacterium]
MPGIDEGREFRSLGVAILTLSDTRTEETDTSGATLRDRAVSAGHRVVDKVIVTDDLALVQSQLRSWVERADVNIILTTGGTGVTGRDIAPEAVRSVAEKEIPGFGELFRWLSYEHIGTSTIQSRAMGAVANGTYIFALPGSTGACRDAWDGILIHQLDNRYRPCNFAELIPRLQEQ